MLTKEIRDSFSRYPVFTMRDVEIALPGRSKASLRQALSHMVSSGRLYRVRSGRYSFTRDSVVSGFAFRPFYYGLLSALTYRDLWDQLSRPEIITTGTVKSTRATVFGEMVVGVHHIPKKYMFGFTNVQYGGLSIPVSDPEKTLIDLFYYRKRLAIQEYGGLLKAVDADRVREYLKAYDGHTRTAVNNFLSRYKPIADSGGLESPY